MKIDFLTHAFQIKYSQILIISSVLLLSSCQKNKKPQQASNQWSQVNSWSFNGKLAINDGENNGSGRIKWLVTNNYTKAQFKAPLGQGSWDIQENQNSATLMSSTNGETTAENAQLLISNELGWFFPWDKIGFWFRGHSSNSEIKTITHEFESITDGDWQITYTKWQQTPMGLLPKKIKASKPPYSVKLVIYKWNFE